MSKGLASQLIKYAEDVAMPNNMDAVVPDTNFNNNTAQKLYLKCGFQTDSASSVMCFKKVKNYNMDNFDWTSFTKKIAVKSDISTIYDAWTKASELEKWFLKKVNFSYDDGTQFDPMSNAVGNLSYEWYWYLYEEPMKGKIISVNGKDLVQFTFEDTCQVDVSLQQQGEFVIVTLRHHNIPLDNHSKQFVRLGCTNGWTFYLTNLKSVYEGGIDLRNKEELLGPMINN